MAILKIEAPQNSQNIIGRITIKAPLAKVFAAHINKELFAQWWGGGSMDEAGYGKLDVKAFEAVDGGRWHTTQTDAQGNTWEFKGCYHEVTANERIIWTFEFLGMPERGHVAIEKMEFRAVDDQTTEMNVTSTYQSVADRDGMIASGMEEGWKAGLDKIEELASK